MTMRRFASFHKFPLHGSASFLCAAFILAPRDRPQRPHGRRRFGRGPGWPSGSAARVEFAGVTLSREDPLTDAGMAPMAAPQRADDGTFLRSLAEPGLQILTGGRGGARSGPRATGAAARGRPGATAGRTPGAAGDSRGNPIRRDARPRGPDRGAGPGRAHGQAGRMGRSARHRRQGPPGLPDRGARHRRRHRGQDRHGPAVRACGLSPADDTGVRAVGQVPQATGTCPTEVWSGPPRPRARLSAAAGGVRCRTTSDLPPPAVAAPAVASGAPCRAAFATAWGMQLAVRLPAAEGARACGLRPGAAEADPDVTAPECFGGINRPPLARMTGEPLGPDGWRHRTEECFAATGEGDAGRPRPSPRTTEGRAPRGAFALPRRRRIRGSRGPRKGGLDRPCGVRPQAPDGGGIGGRRVGIRRGVKPKRLPARPRYSGDVRRIDGAQERTRTSTTCVTGT